MKFTVIFPCDDSIDLSYGLVFVPCPIWVDGEREILNLNPENPYYQLGSVRKLLAAEPVILRHPSQAGPACTVVIHPSGHGSWPDLQALVTDLKAEGFHVALSGEPA